MSLDRLAPAIFVLLWSTGWVVAKYATFVSEPLTFLSIRYLTAAILFAGFCLVSGAAWPRDQRTIMHAIISGATGAEPATSEERAFLEKHPDVPVRATGAHIGHGVEAQFVMNLALAACAVHRGKLFPPLGQSGVERPFEGKLRQAVVTSVGHWRGEGLALVEAVD